MSSKNSEFGLQFVEFDPSGRYGRYNEILGKGSSKTVYRAFDELEGIEVAWNQVRLYDCLQNPEDLERLYCEIHLLKTLKHKNIMKLYASWVDTANRKINFITEMFTSGTLRQYRAKHQRVTVRAVKNWCGQILRGLLYLHGLNPPVIHRDIKCDNIFVNGNRGEVKIGDLGLAAILKNSHADHCVGTPEFMAPEMYEEAYNELVDIYSFGMCILELVTLEYPYSECTNPAQIYRKVTSGKKPASLYRINDSEVREFIEKCITTVSERLSAKELLNDPFFQLDESGADARTIEYREPMENGWDLDDRGYHCDELFGYDDDEFDAMNLDVSIKGRKREDGGIFLRLRVADAEGKARNIYFPFDIETDTALSVAMEMVTELDINDHDATNIADMIDGEISLLVVDWKPGFRTYDIENIEALHLCKTSVPQESVTFSQNDCPRRGHMRKNSQLFHGRFEEITYEAESSEHCVTDYALGVSGDSESPQFCDVWPCSECSDHAESPRSDASRVVHSDEECGQLYYSDSHANFFSKDSGYYDW